MSNRSWLCALTVTLVVAGCAGNASTTTGAHLIGPGSSTNARSSLDRAPLGHRVRLRGQSSAGLGRRTKTFGCAVRGQLPDPACTPGAVFASATLAQICRPGYAGSVRDVPALIKRAVYAEYRDAPVGHGAYEVDHLVPLEVGGSNEIANLWPEISPGYEQKDQVENELHDAVCARRIGLGAAQLAIAHDWRHAGVPVSSAGGATSTFSASDSGGGPAIQGPGSSIEGPGSTTHAGDGIFCSNHQCIANFPSGRGTVVQCVDGEWSHSGGLRGVCYRHGGVR